MDRSSGTEFLTKYERMMRGGLGPMTVDRLVEALQTISTMGHGASLVRFDADMDGLWNVYKARVVDDDVWLG